MEKEDNKIYMNPTEYQNSKIQNEEQEYKNRIEELLEKRKIQEQKISDFSFLGLINKAAAKRLSGNTKRCEEVVESFKQDIKNEEQVNEEQVNKDVKSDANEIVFHAEEVIDAQKEDIPKINEKNELITVPTQVLPVLTSEDLLKLDEEKKQKEVGKSRTLKINNTKGSVFPTILLLATTFTVGIIAAMFIMR